MNTKKDKLGIILSIGCMIHCIFMPILLPILPAFGFIFGHDSMFHLILSAAITFVAGIALIPGYFKHHLLGPMLSASIGIMLIILMGVIEIFTQSVMITFYTVVGSMFIVVGHYLNHKYLCACKINGEHKCH